MDMPRPPLLAGERVLWEGAPPTGLMVRPLDGALIPFSLLWGGFAVFWNASVWTSGAPWFLRLWGLPFLLVGIHVVFGRFLLDAWVRRRQRYYVANRRVLVQRDGFSSGLRALDIRQLPLIGMTQRADGSGTLVFGEVRSLFGGSRGLASSLALWHPALDPTPQFLAIPNVAAVYELIEHTARADGLSEAA